MNLVLFWTEAGKTLFSSITDKWILVNQNRLVFFFELQRKVDTPSSHLDILIQLVSSQVSGFRKEVYYACIFCVDMLKQCCIVRSHKATSIAAGSWTTYKTSTHGLEQVRWCFHGKSVSRSSPLMCNHGQTFVHDVDIPGRSSFFKEEGTLHFLRGGAHEGRHRQNIFPQSWHGILNAPPPRALQRHLLQLQLSPAVRERPLPTCARRQALWSSQWC